MKWNKTLKLGTKEISKMKEKNKNCNGPFKKRKKLQHWEQNFKI